MNEVWAVLIRGKGQVKWNYLCRDPKAKGVLAGGDSLTYTSTNKALAERRTKADAERYCKTMLKAYPWTEMMAEFVGEAPDPNAEPEAPAVKPEEVDDLLAELASG